MAPAAQRVAVVVVTDRFERSRYRRAAALLLALSASATATAAVLPEERADLLYHSYDGGGVEVSGPSLLVRKNVTDNLSAYGNYYVDTVSSASIDVVTTASPYADERVEKRAGVDYLHDNTTLSLSYTNSDESDYLADTISFDISQDMFGDLTTVSLGYSQGNDKIGKSNDPTFKANAHRQNYRVGLSQVLTKNLLLALSLETITDQGYLNNPYRSVRYLDSSSALGFSYEPEVYPETHTSDAVAIRARYYLPYRASIYGEYRRYDDTWGVGANNYEIGYVHPYGERWLFEVRLREYSQTAADFYSDLFPRQQAQNFLARDKELSEFSSHSFGTTVTYDLKSHWGFADRSTVNLAFDHIQFDFNNFRDLTKLTGTPGTEPLYRYSANVLQLYFSLWF